ncbi:NAD-utilizing dehydrogenase [Bacteroidia bacterium]|nr:NAD-utilizing dehydrogenase [Bacteroidia bacterium]
MTEITLRMLPEAAADKHKIVRRAAEMLSIKPSKISDVQITHRSIDARHSPVVFQMNVAVFTDGETRNEEPFKIDYQNVGGKQEVIVVGAGPGGLFAALQLIELGLKPIVVERGCDVSTRKRDVAVLNRNNPVNPESNFAFGEGGAGTFSDGKLNTRSKKRGDFRRFLEILCLHGAHRSILVDAQPHIGTNHLPRVIVAMRQTIIAHGGEVHFNTKMTSILTKDGRVTGIATSTGKTFNADAIILATGHSAQDVYHCLHNSRIAIEAKPFAMGVRIEHPQRLIDCIQYHTKSGRGDYLPAASYSFVTQVGGRGVYSFCMCPGGHIVPTMTAPDEMVVNGMSTSQRNSNYANSGFAVEVRLDDLTAYKQHGALAALMFQKEIEHNFFEHCRQHIVAPAQRLNDFMGERLSFDLPECSYHPGIISAPVHSILPDLISQNLREGLQIIGNRARGFLTNEAVVVAPETRTSSPVRIPRNPATLEHIHLRGLFPCGEGAGYAGGIASSAIDGALCGAKAAEYLKPL